MTESHARLDGTTLIIGNAAIERRWELVDAELFATHLTDLRSGREWISGPSPVPSAVRGQLTSTGGSTLRTERRTIGTVGAEALHVELVTPTAAGEVTRRFVVLDDLPAIGQQLVTEPLPDIASAETDLVDAFAIDPLHCRLVATRFVDQTDHHNELVHHQQWLLHPSEESITVRGNLWYLEHLISGTGLGMVKLAPNPEHRFGPRVDDLQIMGDQLVCRGHGANREGYVHWVFGHDAGATGRTTAIQQLQLRLRPPVPGRDGVAVSNTWGDRSKDSRMTADFLLAEIRAAEQMGIDTVQLDDGWQKGLTSNAWNRPQDGSWGKYWEIDPDFWTARPSGFPDGLAPVVTAAHDAGLEVGLWYSPDSSDSFAHAEADRDKLLELVAEHRVTQIKADGVLLTDATAERRFGQLLDEVVAATDGRVSFDLDVTAQVRLGYWGAVQAGPLFLENRYTDLHNWWPHHSWRNLWRLAHHIHPVRLRLEFLNPTRNTELYAGDPLAPQEYQPATLFAMVMMASPLAWFELSEAPEAFRDEIAELIAIWKPTRDRIHSSVILPIGDDPDGVTWAGLVTSNPAGEEYAVVIRPLGDSATATFSLPRTDLDQVEWLHGNGSAELVDGQLQVQINQPLGHAFLRLS